MLFAGRFLSLVFNRRPTNYFLSSTRLCVSNGLQLAMVIGMVPILILRLVLPRLLTELESWENYGQIRDYGQIRGFQCREETYQVSPDEVE